MRNPSIAGLDWIAVDWGTSALRVWAIGRDGDVLTRASSQEGMGTLAPDGYEPALLRLVGDWLPERPDRPLPVVVCGMAGARQGWAEAAYRTVPCTPVAGGGATSVATRDPRLAVVIVPGLCQTDPPDVMRGEEVQLAGLIARLGTVDATACMPGTHSKWAQIEGGRIAAFTTVMTGELFALLATHSVLRHSVGVAGESRDAFLGGVADMLSNPGRLTASLFSIRAASLLTSTAPEASRSRLSGLLIGAELAAMRERWEGRRVHLIGSGSLAAAYAVALEGIGGAPIVEDAEALTLAGLRLARQAMTGAKP